VIKLSISAYPLDCLCIRSKREYQVLSAPRLTPNSPLACTVAPHGHHHCRDDNRLPGTYLITSAPRRY